MKKKIIKKINLLCNVYTAICALFNNKEGEFFLENEINLYNYN